MIAIKMQKLILLRPHETTAAMQYCGPLVKQRSEITALTNNEDIAFFARFGNLFVKDKTKMEFKRRKILFAISHGQYSAYATDIIINAVRGLLTRKQVLI